MRQIHSQFYSWLNDNNFRYTATKITVSKFEV